MEETAQTVNQTSQEMAHLSVKVQMSVKSSLKKIADEQQRSVHFVMQRALDEYIERESIRKAKLEALYDEADEALKHYDETGLHVSGDEMIDWLESQKSGNTPKPMPPCHT